MYQKNNSKYHAYFLNLVFPFLIQYIQLSFHAWKH